MQKRPNKGVPDGYNVVDEYFPIVLKFLKILASLPISVASA
jgi:hypothetical protein